MFWLGSSCSCFTSIEDGDSRGADHFHFSISGGGHVNALPDLQGRGAHLTEASLTALKPIATLPPLSSANHRRGQGATSGLRNLGLPWWPALSDGLALMAYEDYLHGPSSVPPAALDTFTLPLHVVSDSRCSPRSLPVLHQPLFPPTLVSSNKVLAF